MMKQKKRSCKRLLVFLTIVVSLVFLTQTFAEPTGITISSNATETSSTTSPDNRTDEGGTITTLVVNAVQQNSRWKAYLGNLTGELTLADESGSSIFRWAMEGADLTGNLFITASSSLTWGDINCSNQSIIYAEESTLLFNSSSADSINRTFNYTEHPAMTVGLVDIGVDTCRSASTYVSDAQQPQSSASFPLILLTTGVRLVYASPILNDATNYAGLTSDFQAIVPDIDSAASTTYYFYAEIGG